LKHFERASFLSSQPPWLAFFSKGPWPFFGILGGQHPLISLNSGRIMFGHILPDLIGLLIMLVTFEMSAMIFYLILNRVTVLLVLRYRWLITVCFLGIVGKILLPIVVTATSN
jgi:hypothetical protein